MTTFSKNLNALSKVDKVLYKNIKSIKTNKKYEAFVDEKDSLDINIAESMVPMYANPMQDVSLRYKELEPFFKYTYLYFYGMGNGVLYKMLLQNPQHKRILIIEPELEIIYIVLNLIDFSQDIIERKFIILYSKSVTFFNSVKYFKEKNAVIYSQTYKLILNCNFYQKFTNDFDKINDIFIRSIKHSITACGNDSYDTMVGLEHHIMNLPKVISSPTFLELTKKIKVANCAVLVSTGPSLNKQLQLLEKIQNNVVIVSVDASFPILFKHGIKPDVVVSMERVALTGEFFKKTPKEAHEEVIFALSSVQHPNVINNIKAGIKQFSIRSIGYTKITKNDEWGYIDNAVSAANMAYEIISQSGFKQCILIGQDLAYTDSGNSHADGHVLGVNEVKEKQTDSYVTRYGGVGEIKTTEVWNLFRDYFEVEFAKTKMLTINATEGGSRINGAVEMGFKEAAERYVDRNVEKEKIFLECLSEDKLKEIKKNTSNNIENINRVLEQRLEKIQNLYKKIEKEYNSLEDMEFKTLENFSRLISEIKNYFSDDEYAEFFSAIATTFIVHQEMEIAKIVVRNIKNEIEQREKLIDWIKVHKQWLLSLINCIKLTQEAIEQKSSLPMKRKERCCNQK